MERLFDSELRDLRSQLLEMAQCVEEAIGLAIAGLMERNLLKLDAVTPYEERINKYHVDIDKLSFELIARQAPVARDLRLIVAIMRIITDLERMGDQATNIAQNSRDYLAAPELKPLIDIPRMADETRQMVRSAMDAFVREDTDLAEQVLAKDALVDGLKDQIFRELVTHMVAEPKKIKQALDLILIARNLERIADHATNIAEDVIFAFRGDDVRHNAQRIG